MLTYVLQGLGFGFAAAVQPGPFQTYLISQTLRHGWRRALPAALAPLLSDGPVILVALLALSRLPDGWDRALYIVGGLFVLYLSWGAFRAWRDSDLSVPDPQSPTTRAPVLKAALANAISPGPYLFWGLVTGPILLVGWRESPWHGGAFLIGFYVAMVASLAMLIIVFGAARRMGPRLNRTLVGISALALVCFGAYQLWRGIG